MHSVAKVLRTIVFFNFHTTEPTLDTLYKSVHHHHYCVCVKGIRCSDVLKAVEILLTSYRLRKLQHVYLNFLLWIETAEAVCRFTSTYENICVFFAQDVFCIKNSRSTRYCIYRGVFLS